jgi:hypothetical protein
MPARSQTRPRPADSGGAQSRLPWWAVVPPVTIFCALLLLVLSPRDAVADPVFTHLLQTVRHTLPGLRG